MIGLHQRLRGIVQQAGEDDLLGQAVLHRQRGALQDVVGGREAKLEEIVECGLVGHRREDFDLGSRRLRDEQVPYPHAIVPSGNFLFHFGHGGEGIFG